MSKINVPQEANDSVKGSLETGGGVKLPYPHVFFSFRNGQRVAGKAQGELFYGGFQADQEDLVAYADAVGHREMLDQFTLYEISPRSGNVYNAYMRRSLAIAPIAVRSRWFSTRENKNVLKTQVAALLGVGKPLHCVGAVVVTASGFNQAKNLQSALNDNARMTAGVRREFANSAAPNFFYQFVGTFGDENFEMVGKGENKSPITPIKSYGKVETAEQLEQLYVGDDLVNLIVDYKNQSEDWVNDWKKQDRQRQEDTGYYGEPPELEVPQDEEIPL